MQYYIGSLDDADELSTLCKKYKDYLIIDVKNGRYMVDGCSVLGVISFSGNWVDVEATIKTNYNNYIDDFYKELAELVRTGEE